MGPMGGAMGPHGPQINMILNTNKLLFFPLVTQKVTTNSEDLPSVKTLAKTNPRTNSEDLKVGQDPPRDQLGKR